MSSLNNPEPGAGALDKRVELLRPVYNEWQGEIVDWESVARVWAAMTPTSGGEVTEAGRTVSIVNVPITIRYRKDIDARWRIRLGTRLFDVAALVNIRERGAQLTLNCKEIL